MNQNETKLIKGLEVARDDIFYEKVLCKAMFLDLDNDPVVLLADFLHEGKAYYY